MNTVKTIRISQTKKYINSLILDVETLIIFGKPPIIDRLVTIKKEKKRIHNSSGYPRKKW